MARDRNYVSKAQAEVVGVPMVASTKELRPNKWNYNTQKETTFNKLVAAIRRHGFTKPVIVRELEVDGKKSLEIVDGEHRWRAAQSLGMDMIPVLNLGTVPDKRAKEMTVVLNEIGGDPDEARLGDLLRDIQVDVDIDELLTVMPYTRTEFEMYVEAIDFSFDTLSRGDTRAPVSEEDTKDIESKQQSISKRQLKVVWTGKDAKVIQDLADIIDTGSVENAMLIALKFYADSHTEAAK